MPEFPASNLSGCTAQWEELVTVRKTTLTCPQKTNDPLGSNQPDAPTRTL